MKNLSKREPEKASLKDAFGYIRVSGKGQLDGDGFPRQRRAISQYAAVNGYRIVRWFEEKAVRGAETWENRPAWMEMMENLNGVRTILIERLDQRTIRYPLTAAYWLMARRW